MISGASSIRGESAAPVGDFRQPGQSELLGRRRCPHYLARKLGRCFLDPKLFNGSPVQVFNHLKPRGRDQKKVLGYFYCYLRSFQSQNTVRVY